MPVMSREILDYVGKHWKKEENIKNHEDFLRKNYNIHVWDTYPDLEWLWKAATNPEWLGMGNVCLQVHGPQNARGKRSNPKQTGPLHGKSSWLPQKKLFPYFHCARH